MGYILLAAIALSYLIFPVLSAVQLTGTTVVLGGSYFYIPPRSVAVLRVQGTWHYAAGTLLPLTIVTTSTRRYGQADVSATATSFGAQDDVFQDDFLSVIFVQFNGSSSRGDHGRWLTPSTFNLTSGGKLLRIVPSHSAKLLPNGPYFFNPTTGEVFLAYKLYSDTVGAFSETIIANGDDTYSVLPANIPGQHLSIGVPSRLYYTRTSAKPLAGVRVGIKDIYDVAGLKKGNGNRAWYHLYPAATTSAGTVQRLIDAGAVIVGKMITSQFANGETATADWVDQLEPFNPRGDGYQDTSSSSAGPGAGTGAYAWLDVTLGSDTGGSIRGPSEVQGLFGNRPSHNLVPLDGVMPLSPELDTAGFLTRDPFLWAEAASVLYGSNISFNYTEYPSTILTLDYPTANDTDEGSMILKSFVASLGKYLNAKVSAYDIELDFATNPPKDTPTTKLDSLLYLTYPILISQEQINLVRNPFYADYAAKYDGRRPFIDPAPLARWTFGDRYPPSIDVGLRNKTIFQNWFNSHVLVPDLSSPSCSDKLLLYIGSTPTGQNSDVYYRNTYKGPPGAPVGFSAGRISPLSSGPDFVFPLGEASYWSNITLHTEYLPVTVDILAARGCDGMLFNLAKDLVKAGILKEPKAGRTLTKGEEILFRRHRSVNE